MRGIPGSARTVRSDKLTGAKKAENPPDVSGDIIQVTVVLHPGTDADAVRGENPTRVALHEAQRPNLDDLGTVVSFARDHNLTVVDLDSPPRMVVLRGTVRNITAAFGTKVDVWQQDWPSPRGEIGPQTPFLFRLRPDEDLQVPDELARIVQGVFGIDNRKEARMQMHAVPAPIPEQESITGPHRPRSYTEEVLGIYKLPAAETQGRGQTIAVLSLGGRLNREELAQYCQDLGIKVPEIFEVPLDCHLPQLGDQPDEDAEVALDVHVIAPLVPCASIVIYYVDNTSRGFINGLAQAIYNESLPASVISISWGSYETSWTDQARSVVDDLLKDAKALNITVCCASGDLRASDGDPDGEPQVDFPASSPYVLSCGGTSLTPNPKDQTVLAEVVWDEPEAGLGSGGGKSRFYPKPDWQKDRPDDPELEILNMRGVPDVSGVADPRNGDAINISGRNVLVGGTSAVAPFWAGLIARINENLPCPIGYLNPYLYKVDKEAFRDITEGTNGTWSAAEGWDACTGRGSPNGAALLQELARLLASSTEPGT